MIDQVDSPSFGVGRAQLVEPDKPNNKKILEAYNTYIRSAVILLANNSYTNLDEDIKQVIEFEKKLANITADTASRRDRHALYGNKTDIKGFESKYVGIPLLQIEKDVFKDINNGQINESSPLIVYDRKYFERVGQILRDTPKKLILPSNKRIKTLHFFNQNNRQLSRLESCPKSRQINDKGF